MARLVNLERMYRDEVLEEMKELVVALFDEGTRGQAREHLGAIHNDKVRFQSVEIHGDIIHLKAIYNHPALGKHHVLCRLGKVPEQYLGKVDQTYRL